MTDDGRPLFRIEDVRFRDVFAGSASIRAGATVIVAGPSGSGKSTLLRMLNRMTRPTSGRVTYQDEDVSLIAPADLRRRVAMLAQIPVLFGGDVRDELTAGRRFAALGDVDDRTLAAALEAVRLPKRLNDDPSTFSGGERQRLCLARVLIMETPVVLLDEPTGALDRETESAVWHAIRDWKRDDRTVIISTHARIGDELGRVDRLDIAAGRLVEKRPA